MRSPDQPRIAIAGLVGSLRRNSFNRRLMEAARAFAPASLELKLIDGLGEVPVFDEDLEAGAGPAAVARLREAVSRADGLLIATPEYNQSMPGMVKNLIDWLSRADPSPLEGKPVAVIGASSGPWGTRLAQAALRQTLIACGALVMPAPQLYVRSAGEAFDASGALIDERIAAQLSAILGALRRWTLTVNSSMREEWP